jgi:23S rRNA-/tRNA-specific pseudouridylate synthase
MDENGLLAVDKPAGVISHPNNVTDKNHSLVLGLYSSTEECYLLDSNHSNIAVNKITVPVKNDAKVVKIWLINRLDSATSGVILLSLNETVANIAKKLFAERLVRKTYTAAVFGNQFEHMKSNRPCSPYIWSDSLQLIKHPKSSVSGRSNQQQEFIRGRSLLSSTIKLSSTGSSTSNIKSSTKKSTFHQSKDDVSETNMLRRGSLQNEKAAIAEATIERCVWPDISPTSPHDLLLLKLQPKTGFTHQLRIQCASHGLPIVGDKNYGNFKKNKEFQAALLNRRKFQNDSNINIRSPSTNTLNYESSSQHTSSNPPLPISTSLDFKRLFLHASEIQLTYSYNSKMFDFTAKSELPPEFTYLIGKKL